MARTEIKTSPVAVIGAGSWGTALALALAREGEDVTLWAYEPGMADRLNQERENRIFLPGFRLPESIRAVDDLRAVRAELYVVAVPSHALRATLSAMRTQLSETAEIVIATKGLEQHTLMRVSEVATDVLGTETAKRCATLSGPTFAREIAAGEPAAVVIAAYDLERAQRLQRRLSSERMRLYASSDVIGVELGASVKNVMAIAAGICQGLGLGSNTRAALIARGLAEMNRLALAAGGRAETLAGLAGLGDLVLTCTGDLSRNRTLGIGIGQGRSVKEMQAATPMVAEGVPTTAAAMQLAQRLHVEMPIVMQMYRVLFEALPPQKAVSELMQRPLTTE